MLEWLMLKEMWPCYLMAGTWVLAFILLGVWYFLAKRDMGRRGIEWSGSFDAMASCMLIWAVIAPIGVFMIAGAIYAKAYE